MNSLHVVLAENVFVTSPLTLPMEHSRF